MAEQRKKQHIEGIIRTTSRAVGYVTSDDFEKEIEIAPGLLGTALHGDHVLVELLSTAPSEPPAGEVVRVLRRSKNSFVGTIEKEGSLFFLNPQDHKMYTTIIIPQTKLKNARSGYKAVARITKWSDAKKNPLGEVVRVIGKAGLNETEMKAIVYDKGFAISFPQSVEKEAERLRARHRAFLKEEASHRRDLRGIPTFTIDPETAKDFDDALSLRTLSDNTYEVGIHVADVSFFVKPESALDEEAAKRTTSIYLVDRTIPMLPEALSNDLCSLNPEEDKLAFSVLCRMSKKGDVLSKTFQKTIIRSQKRFSYEEAEHTRESGKGIFAKELQVLHHISKRLREERFEKGALSFDQEEVTFELDKNGKPLRIVKKERLETNRLIEDFMILANSAVAEFASRNDKKIKETFVYRVHDIPKEEKIKELVKLLRTLGYNVPAKKYPTTAQGIAGLVEGVAKEHAHVVNMAVIQAMERAVYATKNIGHFGLSLKHYTHFTSPIRRYPDIMVHRFLEKLLQGKKVSQKEIEHYEALTRYSSEMERIAQEAEWASIKYKQTEYMKERVGKIFQGMITGMIDRGLFVREENTLAEGMVRLRDMKDDYYIFDKETKRMIGEKTKKAYAIGDRVKIQVLRVDVEKRFIDFKLV